MIRFSALLAIIAFQVLLTLTAVCQTLVNNGDGIVINSGAYLVIGGQYINRSAAQDGFVDNDGNMIVYDDFINNAGNQVFTNIEAIPDGITVLPAMAQQSISGTASTRFENLRVAGGLKMLDNDQAYVAGQFSLAAVFDLNSNILELENAANSALNYQSGYLLAETQPAIGLGILRWNINEQAGIFQVPFGTGDISSNDLHLTLNITQPAVGSGAIDFSTYPTSAENQPLPDLVPTLEPFQADVTVNRFWIIDAQQATNPGGRITFTYTYSDVNPIQESTLGAIRFNEDMVAWDDLAPAGMPNTMSNTFTTENILPADFYKNWTLTGSIPEDFIYVPNSFSPNGNGTNDLFYPIVGNDELLMDYNFTIFDRWGSQIFTTKTQGEGWDGNFKGVECQQDVYVFVFNYIDVKGARQEMRGRVTLIR